MKKLILLIIVLVFGVSCSPFKKLPKNSPAYACDNLTKYTDEINR